MGILWERNQCPNSINFFALFSFIKKCSITSLLLVWSCYHNETPETFSLISRTFFFRLLEAEMSETKVPAGCTAPQGLFPWFVGSWELPWPYLRACEQGQSRLMPLGPLLPRALITPGGPHPHELVESKITSQTLHLQIPSHWGLDI